MRAGPWTPAVVYDACVLYPSSLRDLLVRIAIARLATVRVTEQILDETFESIERDRPDLLPSRLANTRRLMTEAIGPHAIVTGYERRTAELSLPDPGDRHVLAAAIESGSTWIITDNTRDFPDKQLAQWSIETRSADEFVSELIYRDHTAVLRLVNDIASSTTRRRRTVATVLDELSRSGLRESAFMLRRI